MSLTVVENSPYCTPFTRELLARVGDKWGSVDYRDTDFRCFLDPIEARSGLGGCAWGDIPHSDRFDERGAVLVIENAAGEGSALILR